MTRSATSFATVTLMLLVLVAKVHGQSDGPPGLLDQVLLARAEYRQIDDTQVASRRAELDRALAELDAMLARSRPGYAQGWKQYLRWDQLTTALADAEGADPKLLQEVLEKFGGRHAGLELPKFARVRTALHDYVSALSATRGAESPEQYATALDDLARHIQAYEQSPTGESGPAIARTLQWLETSAQQTQLVSAVQQRFNYPNLYGQASEGFLGAGFNAYVDRTTPINDVILGTTIHGTGRLTGTQVMDVIPSRRDARLNIMLRGNVHSRNVGYNGPVTIHNTAVTSVSAVKQLVINENGVFTLAARTHCGTNTTIHDICAKCGLIERIAWKRAAQQETQAEAIASQRAAARINGYIDREAIGPVAQANREFQEKFRWPLLRRGHTPRMTVNSGNYGVGVQLLQQSRGQIAAPSPPPALQSAHDLQVQAHETFVSNFATAAIGGNELTDERLAQMLLEATGRVPEELQITEDKEPWSITFANEPVSAKFDGNRVQIAVRANRFTRGRNEDGTVDQEVTDPVEISATYTITQTDSGATLTREGEVNVDFVGKERLSAAQVGVKTFLRRKFESLFKPEFVGEGLQLKGRWARAGKLVVREINTDRGWVNVGWQPE